MLRLPRNKVALIPIRDPDRIGLIWVPDQAKERTDQGIVKYVGPDCKYVEPGMYVTFSGYSGTVFQSMDPETKEVEEDLIILNEDFIFAEICDTKQLDIHGLWFEGKDGQKYLPTYEMILKLLAMTVTEHRLRNPIDIKTPRPKVEEYENMR